LKLFGQAPDCAILLDNLEEGSVQLLLLLASFAVIPARITRAPATTTSESECDKKRAASKDKERNQPHSSPSRSCDSLPLLSRSHVTSSEAT
jgi:hypothetical protein